MGKMKAIMTPPPPDPQFKLLDLVYHLEHHSYELREQWMIVAMDTGDFHVPLCTMVGISESNGGIIIMEHAFDLMPCEEQLPPDERKLMELFFT